MVTPFALVAVITVFGLCMGLVYLSNTRLKTQNHAVDVKSAFYLAEAGLAEAYAGLAVGKSGNVGTMAAPAAIGDGVFWVEATELGGGLVQLECTAVLQKGRVSLGLVAERVPAKISNLGIFIAQNATLNPGTLIDSYDSSAGTYVEQQAAGVNNDQATFGSNGDLILQSGTQVRGDVLHGVGGSCKIKDAASVTGTIGPRVAAAALPPVEVPTIPIGPGVVADDAANPTVIPAGEHGFESLRVRNKARLTILGPATIVAGSLETKPDAAIVFDTRDGPIDIYAERVNLASGSSAVTSSSVPEDVSLQVAGNHPVTLGAKSLFCGLIYAPESTVQVAASFEVFGRLVCNAVNLAAGGRVHLDIAESVTREDILPSMWTWRVVDIPDAVASKGSGSGILLGVDRSSLPAPAEAHEDQWLDVSYSDLAGATRTYAGMESAFDWSRVSEVVGVSRDGKAVVPVPPPDKAPSSDPDDPAVKDPITVEDQAIIDLLKMAVKPNDLAKALGDASPLTDNMLEAVIQEVSALDDSRMKQVLKENSPLSERVLATWIAEERVDPIQIASVLMANSPLSTETLELALTRNPPLSAMSVNDLLALQ